MRQSWTRKTQNQPFGKKWGMYTSDRVHPTFVVVLP